MFFTFFKLCRWYQITQSVSFVSSFGVIEKVISSIVKWGYQDNIKPVIFFFYEKILRAQSHSQWNINQQSKIKQTLNNKRTNFSRAQTCKQVKVACLAFFCFLCAQNLFVKKKKKNRLEIILITSFYYTIESKTY